jgi:hypothetical protein
MAKPAPKPALRRTFNAPKQTTRVKVKRKPVGVLAPGAKFNRRTGKVTAPKRKPTRKNLEVLGKRRQSGPILGAYTRQLQAEARKVRRDRDELIRNQVVLPKMRRDPSKAKNYVRVPLPKDKRTAEGRSFKWVEKKAPATSRSYFDPITPKAKREAGKAERKLASSIQRKAARDYANVLKKPKRLSEIPGKRESAENLRDLKILSGRSRLDKAIDREKARQVKARQKKQDPLRRALANNEVTASGVAGVDLVKAIKAGKSLEDVGVSAAQLLASVPGVSGSLPAGARKALAGRAAVIAQEVAKSPGGQLNKNASAATKALVSIPAGIGAAIDDPVGVSKESVADPVRRWGESNEQFRKRVKKEGFLPEALDATVVVGGGAAITSRMLQKAARAGKLGKKAQKTAKYRRKIQVSAGDEGYVPKMESPSFFRNAWRQAVDERRKRKVKKRVEKGERDGRGADLVDEAAVRNDRPTYTSPIGRGARKIRESAQQARDRGQTRAQFEARKDTETEGRGKDTLSSLIAQLDKNEAQAAPFVLRFSAASDGALTQSDLVARLKDVRDRMAANRAAEDARLRAQGINPDGKVRSVGRGDAIADIDKILSDPKKYITPNLVEKVRRIGDTQRRLSKEYDPAMYDSTIERKRYQAFEIFNDIQDRSRVKVVRTKKEFDDPDTTLADDGFAGVEYKGQRKSLDGKPLRSKEQQNAFTRKEMERQGLDPDLVSYFPDREYKRTVFSPFALGGRRTVKGERRNTGKLLRTGRVVSDMELLRVAGNQNIKRGFNYDVVSKFLRRSADPESMKNGGMESVHVLDKNIRGRGINPDTVYYVNMGRMQRELAQLDQDMTDGTNPVMDESFATKDFKDVLESPETRMTPDQYETRRRSFEEGVATEPDDFINSRWVAVSRSAYEELVRQTTPSGKLGRGWDMARSFISRALLLNATWAVFQQGSNLFISGFLAGVFPTDMAAAFRFSRAMKPKVREAYEAIFGVQGWFDPRPRGGAAFNSQFVNAIRAMKLSPAYQRWRKYGIPGFLDLFSRFDTKGNNAFRSAMAYRLMKREAFRRMDESMGRTFGLLTRVESMLGKGDVNQVMRAIQKEPETIEALGMEVSNWLGDWTSYTARERKILARIPLFYGFIRFSTRLAFYTMPINHPVLTAIMLELGKMSYKELEQIFGEEGKTVPPWEYGNFYRLEAVGPDGKKVYARFQLNRLVPFFNAIQASNQPDQVLSVQLKQLAGFINPLALIAIQQVYFIDENGNKLYELRNPNAQGEKQAVDPPPWDPKWYELLVARLSNLNYYARLVAKTGIPGVREPDRGIQMPNSSVFFPRPKEYKRADKVRESRKLAEAQAKAGLKGAVKEGIFPFAGTPGRTYIDRAKSNKPKKKKPTLPAMPQLPQMPELPKIGD